jgi:O-antigen/teichoic acid export membrane protein
LIVSGQIRKANRATVAGAAFQLAGTTAAFLIGHLTVAVVLTIFALSLTVTWAVMLPSYLHIAKPRRPAPWRLFLTQLGIGVRLEPYVIFMYLNLRIDVFFVARYLNLKEVGIYSVAVIFSELLWLTTDSLTYAVSSRQANATEHESFSVTCRSIRLNAVQAVGFGTLIAVAAPFAIRLLYGSAFTGANLVVWVLLPAAFAMALWRPVGAIMLRFGSPWVQPAVAGIAVTVNVVANVVLLPRIGLVGASLASLLSYSCGAATAIIWLVRTGRVSIRDLLPGMQEIVDIRDLIRHGLFRFGRADSEVIST